MGRQSFENYGIFAGQNLSFTRLAGRYSVQASGERSIVSDVAQKLGLHADDSLLEIGCGPGNLLIPLSFAVRSATGIDHPKVIELFESRYRGDNLQLLGGNFFDAAVPGGFTKALIYGVIHLLADETEVKGFLSKALDCLLPGGVLLVGDIPNEDKKKRFLSTSPGRAFLEEWNRSNTESGLPNVYAQVDSQLVSFNDAFVLDLMQTFRGNGCETFVLPQPPDLPFGRTREDLLICKPQA